MHRALVAFALSCVACAPPAPYYDDELGREAVPVEPGALTGTFALKTRVITLEDTGVLGEQEGGGTNLRLVTRSYDAEQDRYAQQSQLCSGVNYEVAGLTQTIPDEVWQLVVSPSELVVVDHATGEYSSTGHLQLWGLRDLPDPYETALPSTAEEAAQEPHASRIFDMEGDGQPGVTIHVEGLANGDVYGIQRKTVDLAGITLGDDEAVGFMTLTKESLQLGASSELLETGGGSSRQHPDPKESWFEEIRLDETAGCDDVIAAEADGRLSRMGPVAR